MKGYQFLGRCLTALLIMMIMPQTVYALTCEASNSAVSETVNIGQVIKASSSEIKANQKIWVSSVINATFTCRDTDSHPQGEMAYFWLDPKKQAGTIPSFISIGVTYNGIDYPLENGKKVELGPATICNRVAGKCVSPATPQTFNLDYQVYIKATGEAVPAGGVIKDSLNLSLFQVDGEGGLRGGDTNFNLFITGLSKINLMACVPTIAITPDKIDFGSMTSFNASPGRVEKKLGFNIAYGLQIKGTGVTCTTENLLATFSTTNQLQDKTIILPASDSGFGIILSNNVTLEPRIEMNAPQVVTVTAGNTINKAYTAGVLWLSTKPKTGNFSATATVTVTFQ